MRYIFQKVDVGYKFPVNFYIYLHLHDCLGITVYFEFNLRFPGGSKLTGDSGNAAERKHQLVSVQLTVQAGTGV